MGPIRRITLSFREERSGGKVRAVPEISPADEAAPITAQHLVLLIHGYNNDFADAEKAYNGFHERQLYLDSDARYGLGRTFVEVYWPGDAKWGIVSFLFYMGSIRHAIETAQRLAGYLGNRISPTARIDIVAHSMGCRLSLELLRALASTPNTPLFGRIIFMAGAVPTFMLEQRTPASRLRASYDLVLREGARSLYSGSDRVLAFAFPAGQSLVPGAEGFLPVALGHTYWIDTSVPPNLGQLENPGSGHGDYWGWNKKPGPLQCATKAAREINAYLQFPSAGPRAIAARPLVEYSAIEARTVAEERAITAREIPAYA